MLRLLVMFWIRDVAIGALFISDMFGHIDVVSAESSLVIDRIDDSEGSDRVVAHLLVKHWWLAKANWARLADAMEQLIDELDSTILVFIYGCILVGCEVVRHHVDLLLNALRSGIGGLL